MKKIWVMAAWVPGRITAATKHGRHLKAGDNNDQWPGPPDPILDSGQYEIINLECHDHKAVLQLRSLPDHRTGIQITRQMTLMEGRSQVILDLSFTNITNRQIRWSIWDVAQLRADRIGANGSLSPETSCVVSVPLNSKKLLSTRI